MENWQSGNIKNNLQYLVQNTLCNVIFLATLVSLDAISNEEKEEIQKEQTNATKADKFYKLISGRVNGYNVLLKALSATKQHEVERVLSQGFGDPILNSCDLITYDKNCILGEGAKSVVNKGKMQSRDVAVKRLDRMNPRSNSLCNEVHILKDLPTHSNIVQFFATHSKRNFLLIAFELCDRSLEDCVKDKAFPLDKREIFRQATTGLGFFHDNNIIHRDLKPANILLAKTPREIMVVKIADFGLSKVLTSDTQSVSALDVKVAGTPTWIPPEILRLSESNEVTNVHMPKWTLKYDIFPLGCIFCYVLTEGTHPFGSGFRIDINILEGQYFLPDDPQGLMTIFRELIERMICSNPADRPPCAEILQSDCFLSSRSKPSSVQELTRMETDAQTQLLLEPGGENNHCEMGMQTWQQYYIYTFLNQISNSLVNRNSFIDEMVKERMICKRQAGQHRDTWSTAQNVISPFPNLFEMRFTRPSSYSILMEILRNPDNFQLYDKLRSAHAIMVGPLANDILMKASYAIALHYDTEEVTGMLAQLGKHYVDKLPGANGEYLIHIAVGCGNIQIIHTLREMAVGRSCQDNACNFPHHYLGKWSSNVIEATRTLIELGIDISSINSQGETLAHAVAVNINSPVRFHEWCQFMVQNQMEKLLFISNNDNQSPLQYAIVCMDICDETLRLFLLTSITLERGFSLNQGDAFELGLLHYAARSGRTHATMEALIRSGADWKYSDKFGETVLHFTVIGGNVDAVEHLLKLGADVHEKDVNDCTPLHYLRWAYINHVEITKMLVHKGAKLTAVDDEGRTPAHDDPSANWLKRQKEYNQWSRFLLVNGFVSKDYFYKRNKYGDVPLNPNL